MNKIKLEKMKRIKMSFLQMLYTWIIVNEWREYGEFENVDTIIIVGTLKWAIIINVALKKQNSKVYYCLTEEYKQKNKKRDNVKWIFCDKVLLGTESEERIDIMVMPNL